VLALAGAAALLVARHDATAQVPPGPGPQPPPGAMRMPPMPMLPPGGPAIAMVVYKDNLYIAQGGRLFKIDPREMRVVGEVEYVKPPEGPARPGGMGGFSGGARW
jgi:hypothetical protein